MELKSDILLFRELNSYLQTIPCMKKHLLKILDNGLSYITGEKTREIGLVADLHYVKFLNKGIQYLITFNYRTNEQKRKIYKLFKQKLVPSYGPLKNGNKNTQDYIIPYFIDENGIVTTQNTKVIGGVSIPEDVLAEVLRILVEYNGLTLNIGECQIEETFDTNNFYQMLENLESKKLNNRKMH